MKRNLLCTLAEAEFFRIRWSDRILDETEGAIATMLAAKGESEAPAKAGQAREKLAIAFEDAMVTDYEHLVCVCNGSIPDPKDAHVIAAALKTQAAIIVTDNLRDFPLPFLARLNLDARSADEFIADSIALDPGRAVAALKKMRLRLKQPALTAEALLETMDARSLPETVNILKPHVQSL
jgi:predicted nucleic acid-binding protein